MPNTISILGTPHAVATEDELLAFCNRVREAGGADILEALLPSKPGDPQTCLIANALNFGCAVTPKYKVYRKSEITGYDYKAWEMNLPGNISEERQAKVVAAIGSTNVENFGDSTYIELPEIIGNAAKAFDNHLAFQNFARKNNT